MSKTIYIINNAFNTKDHIAVVDDLDMVQEYKRKMLFERRIELSVKAVTLEERLECTNDCKNNRAR